MPYDIEAEPSDIPDEAFSTELLNDLKEEGETLPYEEPSELELALPEGSYSYVVYHEKS